ncbi:MULTISPECIES: glycosyltransferase family 2 protein [Bacteroides]|nr:glycosyltransferase [Bacteroides acidifaciens]MCR1996565.1 glycosyltransferase [Bacteroides acidifaciens]
MTKLSIIVPVYKAEKTIERCIRSILLQDYRDWELILVDDGSPDDSGKICDEYAAIDSRIKVIHKQNSGVGSARNVGLDIAIGERVTFVDSDDEIIQGFFSTTMGYDEDVVSGGSVLLTLDGMIRKTSEIDEIVAPAVFSGRKQIFSEVHKVSPRFSGPCSMIWKRSVIGDIRFNTKMKLAEDTLFTIQCLSNSDTVRTISQKVYKYYTPDSYSLKYEMTIEQAALHMQSFFSIVDIIPEINPVFCSNRAKLFIETCQNEMFKYPKRFLNNEILMKYYKKYSETWTVESKVFYERFMKYYLVLAPIYQLRSLINNCINKCHSV